jgi:hypothetical protein
MREFLIRRSDGEWFDLDPCQFVEALRPSTMSSRPITGSGDHRIEVDGEEISFSYEDPGIQVSFETGKLSPDVTLKIIHEICNRVAVVTGQQGRVVEL